MHCVCAIDFKFSVDASQIHVVGVQLPLPFSGLFDDVAHSKDLVRASSSLSKTCLLLSESLVYCFRDPPDDELD